MKKITHMGLRRRSCKKLGVSTFFSRFDSCCKKIMKRQSLLLYLIIVLFGSSCVTNKQYTFLQKKDVNKRNLPKDTVVREYDLKQYEYRIQPEDNLSIRFESLTPQEFDIFNRGVGGIGQINQNLTQGNAILMGELVDPHGEITYPVIGKVKLAG